MCEEAAFCQRFVQVNVVQALVEAVKVVGRLPGVGGEQVGALSALPITLATLRKNYLKLEFGVSHGVVNISPQCPFHLQFHQPEWYRVEGIWL